MQDIYLYIYTIYKCIWSKYISMSVFTHFLHKKSKYLLINIYVKLIYNFMSNLPFNDYFNHL
jgi:hypothetical protein